MSYVLSATEVMDLIPNRYPICYIDYVDVLEPGKKLLQLKTSRLMKTFFKAIFQIIQLCRGL